MLTKKITRGGIQLSWERSDSNRICYLLRITSPCILRFFDKLIMEISLMVLTEIIKGRQ